MGLDDINVDALLNAQIENYLKTEVTYAVLRTQCLTKAPIQSIVAPVMDQLDAAAKEDKIQKTSSLTEQAHVSQGHLDAGEQTYDRSMQVSCNTKKEKLSNDIQFYRGQLSEKKRHLHPNVNEVSGMRTELDQVIRDLGEFTTLIRSQSNQDQHPGVVADPVIEGLRTQHDAEIQRMHGHPQHHKAELDRKRAHKDHLSLRYEEALDSYRALEIEVSKLVRSISAAEHDLSGLLLQLDLLREREIARQKRDGFRTTLAPFNNKALSTENATRLRNDIQQACNLIDRHCDGMKKDARDRCHTTFLEQLYNHLDGLALPPAEKIALKQLIAAMQQHMRDLTAHQEQQSLLNRNVAALQTQNRQYETNGERYRGLHLEHRGLINTNDLLGAELGILQGKQQTFEEQRNEYAQYALVATIAAGLGAIAGYFLIHTSVLVVAPIVPIVMAGVVGTALVTLLAIAGVAGIRALLVQSQAATKENTLSQNIARMEQITTDIARLGDDAPRLQANIREFQRLIDQQRFIVSAADRTAHASLADAQAIEVETASLTDNRHRFHNTEPSAPPFPRGRLENRSLYGIR